MRRLFPSPATGLERPSGSTTPISMPGVSIGSIRPEMSFGSKSGGSAETTSCRKARPRRARCRDGALPTSRPIHFAGRVSHPQRATAHGNWLWRCWRNANRLSAGPFPLCSHAIETAMASLQQISDADIDDDKAGEYQGNGKPGFCVRGSGRLALDGLPLGGWAFERGNVSLCPILRTGGKVGRRASPAHFTVITPVNEINGGLGSLRLRHLLEQRLVALKEGLGLCGQRGGAIQLGHHFPGRKIGAGPGVGTSRNQHVGSFDRHALSLFALPTRCPLPPEVAGSGSRSMFAVSPR